MTDPLVRIWKQITIPVIFRGGPVAPLFVKLPFAESNRAWLRNDRRHKPEWVKKYHCWSIPKSWFEDIVRRTLERYSKVYVVQPLRKQEKCAPACWTAKGVVCECSCMGKNHGSHNTDEDWYIISDTCALRWKDQEYSYKLLVKPSIRGRSA